MPYKEKVIEKSYFTIGEVAELFNVSTSLIRFWEQEFEILQPKKNKKGNRLFTRKDLDNLRIIYTLVKERGFTLKGAKEKLKSHSSEVSKSIQIKESLLKIKGFLIELKENLETDAVQLSFSEQIQNPESVENESGK
jgi:DNA-binding transcriptional MerR regulator